MCIPRPWHLSWSLGISADTSEESLPCSRAEIISVCRVPQNSDWNFFLVSIKTYYPQGLLLTSLSGQSVFPSWINNLSIDFKRSWYLGSAALLAPGSWALLLWEFPSAALQVLSLGCHFHPQQQDLVSQTTPEMRFQLKGAAWVCCLRRETLLSCGVLSAQPQLPGPWISSHP